MMGLHDNYVDNSLHDYVRFGDSERVLELLNKGYNPNSTGLYKWTCVHEAAHNGDDTVLRILLKKGGDPNKQDELKLNTPLHYASSEGHVECVELLLAAGSKVTVLNVNGEMPSDIATECCRGVLLETVEKEKEALRAAAILTCNGDNTGDDTSYDKPGADMGVVSDVIEDGISDIMSDVSIQDSLNESSDSDFVSHPPQEKSNDKSLGFIDLSFEHNSRRNLLKIRVWQLGDILLPPPHTSTISGIYVKCFLLPDRNHTSKQRTEIVRINQSSVHVMPDDSSDSGVQHLYTPTAVSFAKPLVYSNIDIDSANENRLLRFEVCLMQRFTRKSYLVAMASIGVKDAVKKLVRHQYLLNPCSNAAIPLSMTIHSARCLNLPNPKSGAFHSNPELTNLSLTSLQSHRTSSEIDVHTVTSSASSVPKVIITIPDQSRIEPLTDVLVVDLKREKSQKFFHIKLNMDAIDCNADDENVTRTTQAYPHSS